MSPLGVLLAVLIILAICGGSLGVGQWGTVAWSPLLVLLLAVVLLWGRVSYGNELTRWVRDGAAG